jgi:hypothetical protein
VDLDLHVVGWVRLLLHVQLREQQVLIDAWLPHDGICVFQPLLVQAKWAPFLQLAIPVNVLWGVDGLKLRIVPILDEEEAVARFLAFAHH